MLWRPHILLLLSLACLPSCKGDQAKPQKDTKGATAPSKASNDAPEVAGKWQVEAKDSPPPSARPGGHKALITQAFAKAKFELGPPPLADWPFGSSEMTFFGWAPDGAHFVTVQSIGHPEDLGEAPFWVRFLQVRNIHTQRVVAVFQDYVFEDKNWGGEVRPRNKEERQALAYWKTLENQEKGYEYLRSLGMLSKGKSAPGTKLQDTRISLRLAGKAPRGSKITIDTVVGGFDFRWDHIQPIEDGGDDGYKDHYAPFMHVELERGSAKHLLVKLRSRLSYEQIRDSADERQTYLDGYIGYQWGGRGRRVVITYYEAMHNQHEESGEIERSAHYIRALGPQIKIVDAGIGDEGARKAAAIFDAAGLHVTVVETADKGAQGVRMYYRGESGKASAEAVTAILPDARSEELQKKGWVDLIVVLGS